MANDYGITDAGFRRKTYAEIKADLETTARGEYGQDVNLAADSLLGRLLVIEAERLDELWQLAEATYWSQYPNSADGVALDNVAALVGVTRLPATKSTVTLTASGVAATFLAAGQVCSIPPNGARFVTLDDATIGGAGTVDIEAEAQNVGAIAALAGSITQIDTPVTGWASVTNQADALVGTEIETDSALRIRRNASLQVVGAATVNAIRARLINDVANVVDAFVFENDSDVVDGGGRPPHSFEAVVAGGLDQDIADLIWLVKAAGIATHGTTSVPVTDSQGFTHDVEFSRAVNVPIWMHVELSVDAPFDGGSVQHDEISVDTVADSTLYTVTINGIDYDYTSGVGATNLSIAAGLVSAINTSANWTPVTATDNVDGTFDLDGDLPGVLYVVTVISTLSISSGAHVDATGDQLGVVTAIVDYANGTATTAAEQTIGADIIIDKYHIPIFEVPNILGVTLYIASAQPAGEPPGGVWIETNLVVAATSIALFDSTRVSVELI